MNVYLLLGSLEDAYSYQKLSIALHEFIGSNLVEEHHKISYYGTSIRALIYYIAI